MDYQNGMIIVCYFLLHYAYIKMQSRKSAVFESAIFKCLHKICFKNATFLSSLVGWSAFGWLHRILKQTKYLSKVNNFCTFRFLVVKSQKGEIALKCYLRIVGQQQQKPLLPHCGLGHWSGSGHVSDVNRVKIRIKINTTETIMWRRFEVCDMLCL